MWTRDKDKIFIALYTCSFLIVGSLQFTFSNIQPLFLLILLNATPIHKYLYGLIIAISEVGFLVCIILHAIWNQYYGTNYFDGTIEQDEMNSRNRIFEMKMSICANVVALIGYILIPLVSDMTRNSTVLYMLITVRLIQGLASYSQLCCFHFVYNHFEKMRRLSVAVMEEKMEQSIRRKLVTRFDFTFLDTRYWYAPFFGLLLFFLIRAPSYPLSGSSRYVYCYLSSIAI